MERRWPLPHCASAKHPQSLEEAFEHFDPHRVAFYADRDITRLLKDTRIVRNVAKALIREKVVTKAPTSKADMKAVQAAFNIWTEQSGLPQRDVSRILSFSVGPSS